MYDILVSFIETMFLGQSISSVSESILFTGLGFTLFPALIAVAFFSFFIKHRFKTLFTVFLLTVLGISMVISAGSIINTYARDCENKKVEMQLTVEGEDINNDHIPSEARFCRYKEVVGGEFGDWKFDSFRIGSLGSLKESTEN